MKALIFGGSGKIGSAAAWDLAMDKDVQAVGIAGRREHALQQTRDWIGSDKIVPHVLDINDKKQTSDLMREYDVGIIALPDRRTSYKVAQTAIETGLNIVDMLEEYHRHPDAYETEGLEIPQGMELEEYGEWLHQTALENGVTFIDGMGFAPGLSNVTTGEAIRNMDAAESVIARVGGIPDKESSKRHPLRYIITWTFEHVLREYMIKLKVIKDGKVVEVPAIQDREIFNFNKFGKNEILQCAVTPGMPSYIYTRSQLKDFAERTIRWPEHWQGVDTLKECGLLDLEPWDFDGHKIVPRDFLFSLITPKLKPLPGDKDVSVMYNTTRGMKNGKKIKIEHFMWDEPDEKNGMSSMMRTTGFPVAIAAKFLLEGLITEKGIVPPEDAITGEVYDRFIEEIKKRNINILETTEQETEVQIT